MVAKRTARRSERMNTGVAFAYGDPPWDAFAGDKSWGRLAYGVHWRSCGLPTPRIRRRLLALRRALARPQSDRARRRRRMDVTKRGGRRGGSLHRRERLPSSGRNRTAGARDRAPGTQLESGASWNLLARTGAPLRDHRLRPTVRPPSSRDHSLRGPNAMSGMSAERERRVGRRSDPAVS